MVGGAWQATVHGVAKSRTRLSDFTFHDVYTQTRICVCDLCVLSSASWAQGLQRLASP